MSSHFKHRRPVQKVAPFSHIMRRTSEEVNLVKQQLLSFDDGASSKICSCLPLLVNTGPRMGNTGRQGAACLQVNAVTKTLLQFILGRGRDSSTKGARVCQVRNLLFNPNTTSHPPNNFMFELWDTPRETPQRSLIQPTGCLGRHFAAL